MSTGLGIKGILGMAKQATYTAALDATDKILFMNESVNLEDEFLNHEYLYGGAGTPDTQLVFSPVKGTVEAVLPYSEKNGAAFVSSILPIALGMGTVTWDAGGSYNELTFLDDLDVWATLAVDKGVNTGAGAVWETIGDMISSFEISGEAGGLIKLNYSNQASQLLISATTNTPNDMAALPEDIPVLAMFSDLTFRINAQSGVLASTDNCAISSFKLSVNNNLSESEQASPDDTNCLDYAHTDAKAPIKPARNGFREVTFEITVPRYEADTYLNARANETSMQASLLLSAGASQKINLHLPHLKVVNVTAPVQGPAAIKQTVTFRALLRNTDSDVLFTSGTTIAGELGIETKDERTAAIY